MPDLRTSRLLGWLVPTAARERRQAQEYRPPWLKPVLVLAAWAAVRNKDCYLRGHLYRLKARRRPKKAIIAVAASILVATFHVLRNGIPYRDLGPTHFDRIAKEKVTNRLLPPG